jgi:hypothetical protein
MSGCPRWRSAALLAAFVTVGMGLAACGGGSSDASPNRSVSGCSPSGCSSPGASASLEAMAVKYSGCIRSHGVTDFPDPTIGSNGLPTWAANPNDPNSSVDSPGFRVARQACKQDLVNLGPQTPAEKATANSAALKYAACMRSNGVPNFPDPNGQGLIQIKNATGTLDSSSPQFQQAESACKRLDDGFAQQSSVAVSSTSGSGGSGS